MEETITNCIIQQMFSVLDNAQLKQLQKAIKNILSEYEIVKRKDNQNSESDDIAMEKFIAAKG